MDTEKTDQKGNTPVVFNSKESLVWVKNGVIYTRYPPGDAIPLKPNRMRYAINDEFGDTWDIVNDLEEAKTKMALFESENDMEFNIEEVK